MVKGIPGEYKDLTHDEIMSIRKRGYAVQRSYEYDMYEYNEETNERKLRPKDEIMTYEEWKQKITDEWTTFAKSANCEFFFMIFHDKDVNKDGSEKPEHVHAVFKFANPRYLGSVYKSLGLTSTMNCQPVKNYKSACRYLLHITDKAIEAGKFIYSQSELISVGDYTYHEVITGESASSKVTKQQKDDYALKMHIEIRKNGKTLDEVEQMMLAEFEDELIVEDILQSHRRKFEEDEKYYAKSEAKRMKKEGRELKSAYVNGDGGLGKSTLARAIAELDADDRGIHAVAMSGKDKTFDFTSSYKCEKVTVMDEVTGSTFEMREFCSVFDKHHYSPVNSRNYDKDWLASSCYISNSETINEFVSNNLIYSKGGSQNSIEVGNGETVVRPTHRVQDKAYQVFRRFTGHIELIKDRNADILKIRVTRFNEELKGFEYLGTFVVRTDFYLDKDLIGRIAKKLHTVINDASPVLTGVLSNDLLYLLQDDKHTYLLKELEAKEHKFTSVIS